MGASELLIRILIMGGSESRPYMAPPMTWDEILAAVGRWFDHRTWLLLAAVLPLFVLLLLWRRSRDVRRRLARLGAPALVKRLLFARPDTGWRRRTLRLGLATICAVIALAGPRWGAEHSAITSTGADVVFAVDASLSMMAQDERPNRLERVKQEIRRWRAMAGNDRVALVAFAGRSYVLMPLTIDDGALELFLDNLDPSVVGQPGTSLSRAIRQSADLLLATPTASDRAIVLMSDGEGFESEEDVRQEASRAAEHGISIVTVGFGTEQGTIIPLTTDGAPGAVFPKRDEDGNIVTTRYVPAMLEVAADAGHGAFIPATATNKAENIRHALAKMRVARRLVEQREDISPRFQWFLLPALMLLLADTWISEIPRRVARLVQPVAHRTIRTVSASLVLPLFFQFSSPDSSAALERYGQAVTAGDHSPRTLYNYGTALLAADSLDAAISVLNTAAQTTDAELRYRALFNLGLAHLRRGRATTPNSAENHDYEDALKVYKRALVAHPRDPDATWNYELALRSKPPSGGNGGSGPPPPPPPANGNQPPKDSPPKPSPGSLDEQQARELLNNAAREEQEAQGRVQRQTTPDMPPGGKDW